jgi:hypothetical protein
MMMNLYLITKKEENDDQDDAVQRSCLLSFIQER